MRNKTSSPLVLIAAAALSSISLGQVPPTPSGDGASKPAPKLVAAEKVKDLGVVNAGRKVAVTWTIRNEGAADLIIDKTTASCGCTAVNLADDEKVLPPGKSLEIKAQFDSTGRRGDQLKSVNVYSNDPTEPKLELQFAAIVNVPYEMMPPGRLNVRAVRRGQAIADSLEVSPGEAKAPIEAMEVTMNDGGIFLAKVEPVTTHAGQGQKMRLSVSPDAPLGQVMATASVKFKTGDLLHEVEVSIHGEIVGDVSAQPKMIMPTNQTIHVGKKLAPITLRSTAMSPFSIRKLTSTGPLQLEVEPVSDAPAGSAYTVYAEISDKAQPGPMAAMIEVQTDIPSQPTVEIPVFAWIADRVNVEPEVLVVKRGDTQAVRRIRLQSAPQSTLSLKSAGSSNSDFSVRVATASGSPDNVRVVEVQWNGKTKVGNAGTVSIQTGVAGAEAIEVPILVLE